MKKLSVHVTISNAFAACKESSDNSPGLVDFARLLNLFLLARLASEVQRSQKNYNQSRS